MLESKQQAMVIDRINALSKAIESGGMIQGSEEYKQAVATRQALIQSLYGPIPQGYDAKSVLDAVTVNNTNTGGSLNTSSDSLSKTFTSPS